MQLAIAHRDVMQSAVDNGLFAAAGSSVEKIINILDGEEGSFYGDNDGNGRIQNPGDGIGIRLHLLEAERALLTIQTALENAATDVEMPVSDVLEAQMQQFMGSIEEGQELANRASATAVQLFATEMDSDAITEINLFSTQLDELVETIANIMALGELLQ